MHCSLGRELCIKAGLDSEVRSEDMSEEAWQALHQQWLLWLGICEDSSRMFPVTRSSSSGGISVLGIYDEPCGSVQDSVGSLYANVQAAERFDHLRNALQRAVKTAHKKLLGKIGALEKQKSAAVEAEATQKLADMFVANVYQWPKSARQMKVEDWETGGHSQCSSVCLHSIGFSK
jgi:predicted ribosome quality control (RQC) complex YloA/Tae2 family protein